MKDNIHLDAMTRGIQRYERTLQLVNIRTNPLEKFEEFHQEYLQLKDAQIRSNSGVSNFQ